MRIVHFSDFHGSSQSLPKADLYIGTGDFLANSSRLWLWPDKGPERQWQESWIEANYLKWSKMFASHDSPLFLVKGNHDFVSVAPLFEQHSGSIYEFNDPEVAVVNGVRIAGMRGVKTINGIWADEYDETELEFRLDYLKYKDFDILMTHGPSYGVLDEGYGSRAMLEFVNNKDFKMHCFGHTHLDKGVLTLNKKIISNAATGFNIIDL